MIRRKGNYCNTIASGSRLCSSVFIVLLNDDAIITDACNRYSVSKQNRPSTYT
jgi:hypothetical protein